jgi:uncharacterized membrane protein YgdD (TMEM256/DUF423 family)
MLAVYQTAVQYHLIHAVVLLALSLWLQVQPSRWLSWSARLMLLGLILFSGSLYLLALSGLRPLGMITPLGGVSWLLGWSALLVAAVKLKTPSHSL